eukprot:TRINITY_DN33905_c0_g1_i1.p1 TRINITY_DN33905_c0_g1~~TRINITY_DN33905_c0_g1_i1.p1  ORF type:complete len:706 (+),score=115.17 TRINITY_DN33905_c0_g1_i1:56-2173(+)
MSLGTLHIVVEDLSGEMFELDLSGEMIELDNVATKDAVRMLKETAKDHCCLPAKCIKFVHHEKLLKDDEELHSVLMDQPEKLRLTLVVSTESLYSDLDSRSDDVKLADLHDLQLLGNRGDDRAVAAVIACASTRNAPLLLCALETLSRIARRGDQSVMKLIKECLQSEHDDIRVGALMCLQRMASQGNDDGIELTLHLVRETCFSSMIVRVVRYLQHANGEVRRFVFESLVQTVDESTLEKIVACLEDEGHDVRSVALEALLQLREPGRCKGHGTAVATCSYSSDCDERQLAGQVLCNFQSIEAVGELVKGMFHTDADACRAASVAVMNLMTSWDRGLDTIFDSMKHLFGNPGHDVHKGVREYVSHQLVIDVICTAVHTLSLTCTAARAAAELTLSVMRSSSSTAQLQALKALAALGKLKEHVSCKEIVCAVLPCFNCGDSELSAQACQVLCIFSPKGDTDIAAEISVALCTCESEHGLVRTATVLSQVDYPDGGHIAYAVLAMLLGQRSELSCKVAALQGLKALSSRTGAAKLQCDCPVRRVVLDHTQHPNPEVAVLAATVLQRLSLQGDVDVVPVLTTLAMNTDRPEILLALASLCHMGDEAVLEALCLQLGHGHWPMRSAALQALAMVTPRGCEYVCELLKKCILMDKNKDVRQIAVEVLGSLSEPGDKQVTKFLEDLRDAQPFEVQLVIDDWLERLVIECY